ncbi:MAG: cation diffusion facilitator family transporter [Lentisphaerae bacterium]|nr:cation diffusion facilitator family transporter [Lentisphaerota bacterium]
MPDITKGLAVTRRALLTNFFLAIVKIVTGFVGKSYALIADGIESTTDILTSIIVWSGLRVSVRPPDTDHPYGHGKAESLAAFIAALFLFGSAGLIATNSIREILTPHHAPAPYTLIVLFATIIIKESLFRAVNDAGKAIKSTALKSDAWHHRSDAITSFAAAIGISIALIGGKGYEHADDWAALLACTVIVANGVRLLRPALDEVMDAAAPAEVEQQVRAIAEAVHGVTHVEKCRIRKSGLGLLMDLHVTVDGDMSVRDGHEIGHIVKDRLMESHLPVQDVVVHLEPSGL